MFSDRYIRLNYKAELIGEYSNDTISNWTYNRKSNITQEK